MAERAEGGIDVSVIVAVRNGAETLAQCIDSVLTQTGCHVELIIVDALSDDGTQQIVESYGNAVASYIREADRGIYDAWNKALAVARGDWCSFLGADDYFLADDSVASLLQTAREPCQVPVVVYGGILRVGGADNYVQHASPADPLAHLRSGRMLPHPGTLHQSFALRDIGGFDASYRICGDFVAVLALAARGEVRRCPKVLTAMRIGGISSSWSQMQVHAREKFRALRSGVGLGVAVRHHMMNRWPQIAGRALEQTVLAVLGPIHGTSLLLRLRNRVGKPPKLI